MKFMEYGQDNKEIIMMIHGGGLSWWNYRKEAELLGERYHVLLPVVDGHSESDEDFISISHNAEKLNTYIKENCNGRIKALCGLSLGAQIAVEMLVQEKEIAEYAVIESASLIPSKMTEKLIGPAVSMSYGLINKKWFSKLQFFSLHIDRKLYDDYYRDTCKVSKNNMISFMKDNLRYSLNSELKNCDVKTRIVAGQKENSNMLLSAKLLNGLLKNSTLEIKRGLFHGEYSLNNPEDYVRDLRMFIEV